MTNDERVFDETPFDPASMAVSSLVNTRAVWFKRPWLLITVAVIFVAGVSVVTDITRPITKAQDAATQNGTIKQINADIKPCAYATTQSFQFYNDFVEGTLTSADLSQTTGLLVGDQTVCSFASEPIYDLTNNIQPLETPAGKYIDLMMTVSRTWMTDYALAAIEDIQYLFKYPGTESKIRDLTVLETRLSAERALAIKEVDEAGRIVKTSLIKPVIPMLPHLRGT